MTHPIPVFAPEPTTDSPDFQQSEDYLTPTNSYVLTPDYKGLSGVLASIITVLEDLSVNRNLLKRANEHQEEFYADDIARYFVNSGMSNLEHTHQRLAKLAKMVQPADVPATGYQAPNLPTVEPDTPLEELMRCFSEMVQHAQNWPRFQTFKPTHGLLSMTTYNRLVELVRSTELELLKETKPYPFQPVKSGQVYAGTLFYEDAKQLFFAIDEATKTLFDANGSEQETNPCVEPVTEEDVQILVDFVRYLQREWFELMSDLKPGS